MVSGWVCTVRDRWSFASELASFFDFFRFCFGSGDQEWEDQHVFLPYFDQILDREAKIEEGPFLEARGEWGKIRRGGSDLENPEGERLWGGEKPDHEILREKRPRKTREGGLIRVHFWLRVGFVSAF